MMMGLGMNSNACVSSVSYHSSSFLPLFNFPPRYADKHRKLHGRRHSSFSPKASWQELAGVLIFSAIPFTAVKAIANSPLGQRLQKRLQDQKSAAVKDALRQKSLAEMARNQSRWYGKDRPRWLGPLPFEYPPYLTGELPGDYGFDVAGLGKDPVALQKYFNFEILHARWAMLGALGALIPEVLDLCGAFNFVEPVWWRVGYSKLKACILWKNLRLREMEMEKKSLHNLKVLDDLFTFYVLDLFQRRRESWGLDRERGRRNREKGDRPEEGEMET